LNSFDVTSGLGEVKVFWMTLSGPLKKAQVGNYLLVLLINYGKIPVFRALDWPSSVSGWQGYMAKKT